MATTPRTPRRVQRTRRAGQPGMPPGARYVGRGGRWGSPFVIRHVRRSPVIYHPDGIEEFGFGIGPDAEVFARMVATAEYAEWLEGPEQAGLLADARRDLAGLDLACWCPLPEPGQSDHCHAAVLLRVANAGTGESR